MDSNSSLRPTVFASLFTALIIVGGYLSFPLPFSPVPVVLADFFVLLSGLALGAAWGGVSVGFFLLLGLIGLPVLAGGAAGLPVFFGPTGGFLLGYLAEAVLAGFIARRGRPCLWKDLTAVVAGFTVLFVLGVLWLHFSLKLDWPKTLAAGLLPFIPGTVIKAIALILLIRPLRSLLARLSGQ
ncbi:biotin transport system substrate-specific component [Hydrogenispora ethanolica]|uniref:Biotin transporter n=1 Tax=Hydrogenispora ethanolica TaxID=1082276 RepID=A0A4R1S4A6_HYDET|nr:biotin transporter BioY [Hydrogenispora ethanolica]TCL73192.1 biotin transport system substrate-specific component [Hydrogenispora ethanolica]